MKNAAKRVLLANIGVDTAENEQKFAEILKFALAGGRGARTAPGRHLRRRVPAGGRTDDKIDDPEIYEPARPFTRSKEKKQ